MKRGQSYISITHEDIKHPIIKALLKLGVKKCEIIYASHWSTHAGWEMVNCDVRGKLRWLGFTKKDALKTISMMENEDNHLIIKEKNLYVLEEKVKGYTR